MVDTYGEVANFYNCSNVTFLGGSLVKHGGQNPLEPARLGNYILSGPYVQNFKEIYEYLRRNNISEITSNFRKMEKTVLNNLHKGISSEKRNKIFKIGEKILNKNISLLTKFIS